MALAGALPRGAALAEADPRVAFLTRQLGTATDPRVRAQAALTLGTTEAAGGPRTALRRAGDPEPLVRSAVARSLPELHDLGALECLVAHAGETLPPSPRRRSAARWRCSAR